MVKINELLNTASATGTYNDLPATLTSETIVVYDIDGLTITKSSDKQIWTTGTVEFTLTINNTTTLPFEAPVVTDYIETTIATLVPNTVRINGVLATEDQYSFVGGTLTVNLDDVEPASTVIITFQVQKV